MRKQIIHTSEAPAPIGPYSQAVLAGGFLFVSGAIALDPQTGNLVQDTIEAETHRVMANLRAILDSCGLDMQDVVKTTIFLKNMDDFARVNAVYGEYFLAEPPARETVQVAKLPRDVNVEISVIALADKV